MKTKCKLENCRGCAYEVEKYSPRKNWQLGLVLLVLVVLTIIVVLPREQKCNPEYQCCVK